MALPSILYWEDSIQTGAVFGTVLVILLSLASYSLITVVCYTCNTLLLVVVGVKAYSYVMVMMKKAEPGSNPLSMMEAMPVTVPAETISNMSTSVTSFINKIITEFRRLFFEDNEEYISKITMSRTLPTRTHIEGLQ